jgi:hypothetical protein
MNINAVYGKTFPILKQYFGQFSRRIKFSYLLALWVCVCVACLAFPLQYSLIRQGEGLIPDFKLSPCCVCCILSLGWFPGV